MSFEDEIKAMEKRAAQIGSLDFALEFADKDMERKANAIEYGHRINNTIVPPKPFMRATRELHESAWAKLLDEYGSRYIEGGYGVTLEAVVAAVSGRMEDDYRSSALSYGIPDDICSGLRIECRTKER